MIMSLGECLNALIGKWRAQAIASREEAGRIRCTIHAPTDAEERCNVSAEVWDKCADELAQCCTGAT